MLARLMPVPDPETLFRFIGWDDYEESDGTPRVRSSLFNLSFEVSFNLGSIWPLEHHRNITPIGWGLCSLTHEEWRRAGKDGLDLFVESDPLDHDPFLKTPNPSHASANRKCVGKEGRRAAKVASQNVHFPPKPASQRDG